MRASVIFAAAFLAVSALPTLGAETAENRFLRLCNSTTQDTCWLKAETRVCKHLRSGCGYAGYNMPIRLLMINGDKAKVETPDGVRYAPISGFVTAEPE